MHGPYWPGANDVNDNRPGKAPMAQNGTLLENGAMPRTERREPYSAVGHAIGRRMEWVHELVEPNAAEVSRMLDIDPSTLNKWKKGTRLPPTLSVISFANHFRCSTDFLLRGLLVAETDPELALMLAARHPELVLPHSYKDRRRGNGSPDDTSQRPK